MRLGFNRTMPEMTRDSAPGAWLNRAEGNQFGVRRLFWSAPASTALWIGSLLTDSSADPMRRRRCALPPHSKFPANRPHLH